MKKWIGCMMGILIGICMVGCGKKETGSELLSDAQAAVEPMEETVEPAVEETSEGIALHVYCGDEQAENIVQKTVYVNRVTEQTVMTELLKALDIQENISLKSIRFGMHGGDRVAVLDLNQAFSDYLNKLGDADEYIVMGSLTNTFLDCYQCELMLVSAEGKVLETGHAVYEEYLEMYPFTASNYRVRIEQLEAKNLQIDCPQIEGLGDERIQEKWNRIMLENEQQALEAWGGDGTYTVTYTVKTSTPDTLSILMEGNVYETDAAHPYSFQYTYNIDLNTGKSIRLKDHVDVETAAEHMFAGTGYYVDEQLAPYFIERLNSIYESPEELARSLEGYDYAEDGTAPYGYSYLENGKVWLCMEVPHALGDYIQIELDTF